MKKRFLPLLCLLCACGNIDLKQNPHHETWSDYLGDPSRSHYTTLDQISADNLDHLEIAWIYESPDTGQMQMNPLVIDGKLYGVTAALKAFALDAETGEQQWIYGEKEKAWHSTSRGVSYWAEGDERRIFFTRGDELIALDALTGEPVFGFGEDGKVDLHTGLPEIAQEKFIISNTPGAIFEDLIIMPVRVSEGIDAAPGDIRAFSVRDGSLRWTFHVIPYPGEEGFETWENKKAYLNTEGIGAGNNWCGMTVDEEEGVIYVPTGSIAPDFVGSNRGGENLFSNCLLALDGRTGKLIWHQQLVHHDIWDRDLPAPPNLMKIRKDGRAVEAVVQVTKQGYVYAFDKRNGEPIHDIVEVPFPQSKFEDSWPTQPLPVLPEPFARRSDELTDKDYSPFAPNSEEVAEILRKSNKAFYNPPDTTPTLLLPGYDGAAEWGGAGVDPEAGIIYINSNEMAWILQLEKTPNYESNPMGKGERLYANACATCHGKRMEGNAQSGYPALTEVKERLDKVEIMNIVKQGKGRMMGFPAYEDVELESVANYILGKEEEKVLNGSDSEMAYNLEYKHAGYKKFLDANGLPAISPPWGTLSAIDMNSGEYLWKNVFGEIDSLMELGYPATGSENYGGPIITENGLLIIAATIDGKARIYNRHNGELLWSAKLPAASFATPSTYMVNGKQYIVFACGGEKLGTEPGNKLVAFALGEWL